jgi:hypothetical protein
MVCRNEKAEVHVTTEISNKAKTKQEKILLNDPASLRERMFLILNNSVVIADKRLPLVDGKPFFAAISLLHLSQ